ncbi:putative protein FAR1-RELATED SEQUENCE 10 [Silene latifolia]|uniref:putative protein FAR1-RELATED SEQUENCE 10 n=1 Tax=Silene latifolia TaxID=37657 RepID=UPI003D77533E
MDNQSGSNIDDIHDERIETERFSGFSGDDNDGEYNFEDIGLSDDEELIPGSNSSTLEECAKENGEEDNLYNSDKEVDDENEHSVETEVEAPKDGMKFDTVEDLLKHLTDYAKQCAFSVRLRNVKPARNTNKPAKHILWICHKGRQQSSRSKNKMKPRPSQMTNCGANFNAKEFEGQWMYTSVNLDHNHPLKLEDIRYLRAFRKVPKEVERRIMINDEAGIRPSKTYLAEAVKSHGFQNLPFLERDMRNPLKRRDKRNWLDQIP